MPLESQEMPKLSPEARKSVCRYFLLIHIVSNGIPYIVTHKIIIVECRKVSTCRPTQVSLYRIFSRWRNDRYGLLQWKSLPPEYLITLIISTRSHCGLHSNASWSNTIMSLCDVSPPGNRYRWRVVVCNTDYYYDETLP